MASIAASVDRLQMRARPVGAPVMHQTWENLLFLHWAVPPDVIRSLIPAPLEIDTFEGNAWVSLTPFALTNLHFTSLPPFPGLSSFYELNARTYVLYRGTPGIWFFSLDASKLLPALAARVFFMLPYYKAQIEFAQGPNEFDFSLTREQPTSAQFQAHWQVGIRLRAPDTESLAFFLVERYCYFAVHQQEIYLTRIYHSPWILDEAMLSSFQSTVLTAAGLPEPVSDPRIHFSRSLSVEIWPPINAHQPTAPGVS